LIVLDTHVWLWWLHDPERLSPRAREILQEGEALRSMRVSAISVWEVAVKVELGKLKLPMDVQSWYEMASTERPIIIEPLAATDLIASTRLPGSLHRDPADRLIVALARRYSALLVTRDRQLLEYPHVETIW
jgi:PIN domain nuclease of toxin-antitoxin system